ncbi:hypothetical protein V491_08419, partial [Pseudogymnoascus sp. VKM F-3775]
SAAIDGDEPVRPHSTTPKFSSFNMGSDYKSSSAQLARSIRKTSVPVEHLSRTSEEELGADGTVNRDGAYGMDRMSGSISPRVGVRVDRSYEVHTAGRSAAERDDVFC